MINILTISTFLSRNKKQYSLRSTEQALFIIPFLFREAVEEAAILVEEVTPTEEVVTGADAGEEMFRTTKSTSQNFFSVLSKSLIQLIVSAGMFVI